MENGISSTPSAVLVSVVINRELPELVEEHLEELAFLAETAGIQPLRVGLSTTVNAGLNTQSQSQSQILLPLPPLGGESVKKFCPQGSGRPLPW